MTTNLIISPRISQHTPQPVVGSIDKNISFYCQGVNYNDKEVKIIILDGKNARDDVVGHYLVKKCLLDFDIYDEIEELGEDTLSFSNYGLKGFLKGSLTFTISKVKETRNKMLEIKIESNLFNSNSKTLLLPINNRQVEEVLFPYRKTWKEHDKDINDEILKIDWSSITGKTFTIENINGEKCYFEGDNLILNEFGIIKEVILEKKPDTVPTKSKEIEETIDDYKEILGKYKKELERTKQLLAEKEKIIEDNKKYSQEKNEKDKENLVRELKQANQLIKELEENLANTEKRLRELYSLAKNGSSSSSSPPNQPNNSNLKVQLTKLQQEKQQWQNKLSEEKQKNKDLEDQIKNYQNQGQQISTKTAWETIKKPVLIGGAVAGGLFIIFIIYKKFIAKYF